MKFNLKTGILFVIIGLPVLVFLFLKLFGSNTFDLPYFFPELNEDGKAVVTAKGDTVYQKIPDFNLLNQDSVSFNSSSLNGKTVLVNFFFSRCGTICPLMHNNLSKAIKKAEIDPLEIVSISIDPEYDRPNILHKYGSNFTDNWTFLTGDKEYIYDLAIKGFKLPVSDASIYDSTVSIDEAFIHSDKTLLFDSLGYCRGIFESTNAAEMERLIVELDVLDINKHEKQ